MAVSLTGCGNDSSSVSRKSDSSSSDSKDKDKDNSKSDSKSDSENSNEKCEEIFTQAIADHPEIGETGWRTSSEAEFDSYTDNNNFSATMSIYNESDPDTVYTYSFSRSGGATTIQQIN